MQMGSGQVDRCPMCGKEYPGEVPRICLNCGWQFEQKPVPGPRPGEAGAYLESEGPPAGPPPGPPLLTTPYKPQAPLPYPVSAPPRYDAKPGRLAFLSSRTARIAIALGLAALLVAGIAVGAVVAISSIKHRVPPPTTQAGIQASVDQAGGYLTAHGRELAEGRDKGAPIYSVSAKLDTNAKAVSGEERLVYTNNTGVALSDLVLRVYANSPSVSPQGNGATVTEVTAGGVSATSSLSGSLLRVTLPAPLGTGKETMLKLSFYESLPEVWGGIDFNQLLGQQSTSGYGVFGYGQDIYDLGFFIPTVATYSQGGWDNREAPAFGDVSDFDCSYYSVSIDVPEGYVVAAAGLPVGEGGSSGRKVYDFRGGPMRDFSAQISASYLSASTGEGETLITSYYTKAAADTGNKVLGFARDAIKQYNQHFGAYPYKRFNVCEAPLGGGAGGMEFAGQVQIGSMLYSSVGGLDLGQGSELGKLLGGLAGGLGDMLEFTVAHEVCHQWWGLTVGSDSIGHPWQDESLTNYCTVLYFRWQHGADSAKQQVDSELMLSYSTAQMMGSPDMAVDSPVYAFKDQNQYSAVVYSKGALFFQALEKSMGEEAFEKSLQQYYQSYAFKNATPDQMMACFESNGSAATIAALDQRWIHELHASEDIAATSTASDLINNLMKSLGSSGIDMNQLNDMMKQFLPEGTDMNQLNDMLKQYMQNGSMPQIPGFDQQDQQPVLPF